LVEFGARSVERKPMEEGRGKMEEKRTKKIRSCENEGKRGQRSEIGGRRIEDNGVRIRD
jgi:hypothetical protein